MRVGERVLQAFEVQAGTVDAKRSGMFVFVVEDRSREKVEELRNVAMSDVVTKLIGVLIPQEVVQRCSRWRVGSEGMAFF